MSKPSSQPANHSNKFSFSSIISKSLPVNTVKTCLNILSSNHQSQQQLLSSLSPLKAYQFLPLSNSKGQQHFSLTNASFLSGFFFSFSFSQQKTPLTNSPSFSLTKPVSFPK
jgi:hypothetical protein